MCASLKIACRECTCPGACSVAAWRCFKEASERTLVVKNDVPCCACSCTHVCVLFVGAMTSRVQPVLVLHGFCIWESLTCPHGFVAPNQNLRCPQSFVDLCGVAPERISQQRCSQAKLCLFEGSPIDDCGRREGRGGFSYRPLWKGDTRAGVGQHQRLHLGARWTGLEACCGCLLAGRPQTSHLPHLNLLLPFVK